MLRKFVYGVIALAVGFAAGFVAAARAEGAPAIYTGSDAGAYNTVFCPPIGPALQESYFYGYTCTPSDGTLDNIEKVLANPSDIGFAQLDVFARGAAQNPEKFANLTVVRELACEGLWMVTKNPKIDSYGAVLGLAQRIPFVLPPEASGSTATFKFLGEIDPQGIGRARNVTNADSTASMLDRVGASEQGEVGLFVQFADPKNANIKKMMDAGLTVFPVVSREIINQEVDGQRVYKVQEFELESGFFSGKSQTTTCTPAVIFTGAPSAFTDPKDAADQTDLITALKEIPAEALLPKEGRFAKLVKAAKSVSDKVVDEMIAATEKAKVALANQ